ncbi:Glycosyl transferase family 2 [Nonlabens sp. Hel1_33_55]|uniref:glycosyltransferase family 2 protein n=1 Tax=Nonlabens sp. Hel1_33_55 TaxID=1336802 RepID=UPI000875D463|nr:glycosyltransferase family 2 protein [Nonlabens sp. Hel1_33_55]SCX92230.1 Glycosyl transferase family 2 [Nonlabens sp. Hel1_33_55]
MFEVSVIIPVFNADQFIEKAVRSASELPQVREIIIVNDGSTDGTSDILKRLSVEIDQVCIFHHADNSNKGRSASRNLGIQNAKSEFIAFLDADDYYLENRFLRDSEILKGNIDCDGVYNAIGVEFYREERPGERDKLELISLNKTVEPDALFESLISGNDGYFSLDALTVRKSLIQAVGGFNEKLEVSEDTELIWKLSLKGDLLPGILRDPVAVRGVHDNNIFNQESSYKNSELQFYISLFKWHARNFKSKSISECLLERVWIIKRQEQDNILAELLFSFQLLFSNFRFQTFNSQIKYNAITILMKRIKNRIKRKKHYA